MKRLSLALLLCLTSTAAWAQTTPGKGELRPLSLRDSVQLALQNNVKTKISKEKIHEAEASIDKEMASFFPHIQWDTRQGNLTLNLAQQGLAGSKLPIPVVVGPFYTFDTRIKVLYNFLDSAARWRLKSAEMGKLITQVEDQVATQEVVTLTSLSYVNLVGARDAQTSAQADLDLSDKLVKLAKDQKDAGIAAGIDVTRAEAQRSEQLLRLNSAVDAVNRANLELARLIGLPLTEHFNPTEQLFPPLDEVLTFDKALKKGMDNRLDLILAKRQEERLALDISAAEAGTSPTMGLAADYGLAGNTPGMNVYGTHTVGLSLSVPLFDGGLSDAKVAELRSRLEQAKLSHHDTEVQVEQDIRNAFLKLTLAAQQIKTAQVGRQLAEREVKMSSDRFKAGLANSLEVSTASAGLTRARDSEVQATVRYNLTLVELAATMGSPEAIFEIYQKPNPNPGRPQ